LPVLRVFVSRRFNVAKKLYVGNLSYNTSDSDLQRLFEEFGTVDSAQVISDRETGRSKGFGFVEMGSDQEAQAAISALNGKEVDGRALTVNEAKPREERGGGGRGGYGGGRSGGGDRGGYGGGRKY
jgi:RNA recognition motif-containing protein